MWYSRNYVIHVSSPIFWHFGKKFIFLVSVTIEKTLSKLLCIVSLTLVIFRYLHLVKPMPPTGKTAVELYKSKPHISAWMGKVRAMLDTKETYQVQRSVINLVSACSTITCVQEHNILAHFPSRNAEPTMDSWDLNPLKWLDVVLVQLLNIILHS